MPARTRILRDLFYFNKVLDFLYHTSNFRPIFLLDDISYPFKAQSSYRFLLFFIATYGASDLLYSQFSQRDAS